MVTQYHAHRTGAGRVTAQVVASPAARAAPAPEPLVTACEFDTNNCLLELGTGVRGTPPEVCGARVREGIDCVSAQAAATHDGEFCGQVPFSLDTSLRVTQENGPYVRGVPSQKKSGRRGSGAFQSTHEASCRTACRAARRAGRT
jgi:hypothetical protein